jgi:hypothetical protein
MPTGVAEPERRPRSARAAPSPFDRDLARPGAARIATTLGVLRTKQIDMPTMPIISTSAPVSFPSTIPAIAPHPAPAPLKRPPHKAPRGVPCGIRLVSHRYQTGILFRLSNQSSKRTTNYSLNDANPPR